MAMVLNGRAAMNSSLQLLFFGMQINWETAVLAHLNLNNLVK
jgi:hypothetical protein